MKRETGKKRKWNEETQGERSEIESDGNRELFSRCLQSLPLSLSPLLFLIPFLPYVLTVLSVLSSILFISVRSLSPTFYSILSHTLFFFRSLYCVLSFMLLLPSCCQSFCSTATTFVDGVNKENNVNEECRNGDKKEKRHQRETNRIEKT